MGRLVGPSEIPRDLAGKQVVPSPALDLSRYQIVGEPRKPEPGELYWWPVQSPSGEYNDGPKVAGREWEDPAKAEDPLQMAWGRLIVKEVEYPEVWLEPRGGGDLNLMVDGAPIWVDVSQPREKATAEKLVEAYNRLRNANS